MPWMQNAAMSLFRSAAPDDASRTGSAAASMPPPARRTYSLPPLTPARNRQVCTSGAPAEGSSSGGVSPAGEPQSGGAKMPGPPLRNGSVVAGPGGHFGAASPKPESAGGKKVQFGANDVQPTSGTNRALYGGRSSVGSLHQLTISEGVGGGVPDDLKPSSLKPARAGSVFDGPAPVPRRNNSMFGKGGTLPAVVPTPSADQAKSPGGGAAGAPQQSPIAHPLEASAAAQAQRQASTGWKLRNWIGGKKPDAPPPSR